MTVFLENILTHLESQHASVFACCSGKIRGRPASFKEYLFEHACFKLERDNLVIEPTGDDLKKLKNALFRDFEHFYIKAVIQYIDYNNQLKASKTWNIVTHYYFLFFCITSLCKYIGRGCIYFNSEEIKKIEAHLLREASESKPLYKGVYTYFVEKIEDSLKISLSKDASGMGIHEKAWELFHKYFICTLMNDLNNKCYDFSILMQIDKTMNAYKENFPSIIRNNFNYQGCYSIDEIQNNVPALIQESSVKEDLSDILTTSPKRNDDISTKLKFSVYLGIFTYSILKELQADINNRLISRKNEFNEILENFVN